MPPSKHSGSSRSAHKDSDQIPVDNMYVLGDYHFALERTSIPGSTNDKIEAICTKLNESKRARKSIQVPSATKLLGWYVEANETEASVYAKVLIRDESQHSSSFLPEWVGDSLISSDNGFLQTKIQGSAGSRYYYTYQWSCEQLVIVKEGESGCEVICASKSSGSAQETKTGYNPDTGEIIDPPSTHGYNLNHNVTHEGKNAYWTVFRWYFSSQIDKAEPVINHNGYVSTDDAQNIAWTMLYGFSSGEPVEKEILIGRFAIEIKDAGGVGPGSDWEDPGDYDEDWEEGDPTHTLYATVTGALSGRHNDPIEDPSYSYIPADKDTVKDYGCGGDGGHGGGGGAGASTVVIHKFATNQANFKEVTAIARRHGYGSGGGKGGKGGDGCILVYY